LPNHPEKLLRSQQRTGVNVVHGYKVLHLTAPFSRFFSGLTLARYYDAIRRNQAHPDLIQRDA